MPGSDEEVVGEAVPSEKGEEVEPPVEECQEEEAFNEEHVDPSDGNREGDEEYATEAVEKEDISRDEQDREQDTLSPGASSDKGRSTPEAVPEDSPPMQDPIQMQVKGKLKEIEGNMKRIKAESLSTRLVTTRTCISYKPVQKIPVMEDRVLPYRNIERVPRTTDRSKTCSEHVEKLEAILELIAKQKDENRKLKEELTARRLRRGLPEHSHYYIKNNPRSDTKSVTDNSRKERERYDYDRDSASRSEKQWFAPRKRERDRDDRERDRRREKESRSGYKDRNRRSGERTSERSFPNEDKRCNPYSVLCKERNYDKYTTRSSKNTAQDEPVQEAWGVIESLQGRSAQESNARATMTKTRNVLGSKHDAVWSTQYVEKQMDRDMRHGIDADF
eukprot:TRINITY_DN15921_c0_g1_i1.p1 TRINITY_DN15921_c0_g1~~TRINITY_DN15921_c0_g1_i1.p1  ORF type:complete len:390 (+),score=102.95 TRINITY_DN15921_c0_g1_i1:92-1261(+)